MTLNELTKGIISSYLCKYYYYYIDAYYNIQPKSIIFVLIENQILLSSHRHILCISCERNALAV